MSRISSGLRSRTTRPRLLRTTSPSCSNRVSASRTGVRLTSYHWASAVSTNCWPGSSSPSRMACLMRSYGERLCALVICWIMRRGGIGSPGIWIRCASACMESYTQSAMGPSQRGQLWKNLFAEQLHLLLPERKCQTKVEHQMVYPGLAQLNTLLDHVVRASVDQHPTQILHGLE